MCLATLHRSVANHSERDQGAAARGTHTGTHLDALGHYSRNGRLYGGVEAAAVQTKTGGLTTRGIEEAAPRSGAPFSWTWPGGPRPSSWLSCP